jgi:hypothetical protein
VLHRYGKFALIALVMMTLAPALAQSPEQAPVPGQSFAPPAFQTPAQEGVFRRVANEFIAAAVAGDTSRVRQMISPTIASGTGPEAVERYLTGQVLPFFAQFKELGRSVTVTRTADAAGFVFYMYMVSSADELRPFVIYVIEENGAKVIADVLVDSFVEGRHCARVADGWKCPDFR